MAGATIVMKLRGPVGMIEGECEVEGYEKRIVLEDWKWSVDFAKDRKAPGRFSFGKLADRATVPMLKVMKSCELCPEAEVLIEEDSADSRLELKVIMKNVQIMDYSMSSRVGEKSATIDEDWEFEYTSIRFEYTSYGSLDDKPQFIPFVIAAQPPLGKSSGVDDTQKQILSLVNRMSLPELEGIDRVIEEIRKAAANPEHAARKLTATAPGGPKQEKR